MFDCKLEWVPFIFALSSVALWDWSKENIGTIYVRECCLCSPLGVLWCHVLYLSCLAIFSLFLYVVWGHAHTSLIYMRVSQLFQHHLLKKLSFPIVHSCLLCQRLIVLWCVGLYLGCLLCSIDPYVYFSANTTLFDYCSFVVLSEVWEDFISSFVLFPKDCFGNFGLLWFHINFETIYSSSMKNVLGNLISFTLDL